MESGGGVLPASEAAFQAANLLTSGPAGGVLASQKLGEQLGYRNILTTDMGGTSFDVGIIVNGEPVLERMRQVGRFHVALPSIKVTAIGAGGGSIARVRDGHLTVGPGFGRRRARARLFRPRRHASRPSPTPMSCSASSTPTISSAAR